MYVYDYYIFLVNSQLLNLNNMKMMKLQDYGIYFNVIHSLG